MKQQGFSTTVFCKLSVRRGKYCLEFSIPVTVPFMFNFRSSSNKFPTIVWSLIFGISLPRLKLFFAQKDCERVSQNRYQLPSEKHWTHEFEAKCARPVKDGVHTVESHGIQNGYCFMYGTQIVSFLLRRTQKREKLLLILLADSKGMTRVLSSARADGVCKSFITNSFVCLFVCFVLLNK